MNKLLLGLTAFALALGLSSPSAYALECDISGTGPDSENTCKSIEDFKCTVTNNNDVKVYNDNEQVAVTGGSVTIDNTSGGSSTSGGANNSNSTVVEGTIKNNACVIAAPAVVTPPSAPVTPSVTPSGGQGEVVTPVAAPAGKGAVATLPNTSAQSTAGVVAGLVALLATVIVGSRFAISAYGSIKS
jgi:hypothetical protein